MSIYYLKKKKLFSRLHLCPPIDFYFLFLLEVQACKWSILVIPLQWWAQVTAVLKPLPPLHWHCLASTPVKDSLSIVSVGPPQTFNLILSHHARLLSRPWLFTLWHLYFWLKTLIPLWTPNPVFQKFLSWVIYFLLAISSCTMA